MQNSLKRNIQFTIIRQLETEDYTNSGHARSLLGTLYVKHVRTFWFENSRNSFVH